MKLGKSTIHILLRLINGEAVAESSIKDDCLKELRDEGLISTTAHKSRRSVTASDKEHLAAYIERKYNVYDLEGYYSTLSSDSTSRAKQVEIAGDSKIIQQRSMMGFLVNSCENIAASINGHSFSIHPQDGTFTYIYDYQTFKIDIDTVVVGIENSECFRRASKLRRLFKYRKVLFVSRYPQSKDLSNWLKAIPNEYVHFGDFDLAGVHIYLNEFYKYLGARASFFVPDNIESLLEKGSSNRYNDQYDKYYGRTIADVRVLSLVKLINNYKKGYDQEGLINECRNMDPEL